VGPGDDAAVVTTGSTTLVTTDSLVEGIHFRREWTSARRLGRKALSVNLSDIGGMGGRSLYATVSLCLPPDLEVAWLDGLYDGLLERAGECGLSIVGGNLSAIDGPIVIDVMVLGESARTLLRAGARSGDRIVVTGTLGAASGGLALLRAGLRLSDDDTVQDVSGGARFSPADQAILAEYLRAHLDPAPPIELGAALARVDGVHAGMDVSDGLSGDLLALCTESQVTGVIDAAAITPPAVADLDAWGGGGALERALHGGEDYGLLLAVEPRALDEVRALAAAHGVAIADIGLFAPGPAAVWLEREGRREALPPRAHQHFGPGTPRRA
jgi:thiamine-monophosphate kinase